MSNYKISIEAKKDLIRIHHYGVQQFSESQADKYFNILFQYFDTIADNPFAFEDVGHIQKDTEDALVVQTVYILKSLTMKFK